MIQHGGIQMLGIIGAMEVEVEKLRAKMTETEMKTVAGENWRERTLSSFAPVSVR
jgi:adenosylhomocysteine nucleosidase